MTVTYLVGDTRRRVAELPDGSVDLVLSSPPFLALRSYLPADHPDKAAEIGSEPDPAAFIDVLLELTAEWRRVLAPHGSLCIELGDTYSGSGGAGGDYGDGGLRDGQAAFDGSARRGRKNTDPYPVTTNGQVRQGSGWPLAKSLTLAPELYRVALAYGRNPLGGGPSPAGRWRVRNVVRWVRPNPPVGALGDKFRPATSDLVVACTAGDRWFDLDAVRTPHNEDYAQRRFTPKREHLKGKPDERAPYDEPTTYGNPAGAPPLDWWEMDADAPLDYWKIVPKGYEGSHYATWPPELCVRPIDAMCPRRVCRTCGKPSRRETSEPEYVQSRNGGTPAVLDMREGDRPSPGVNNWSANGAAKGDNGVTKLSTTTGWSSCGCPGTDGIRLDGYHTGTGWRPGVVLDPFAGTGTTLAVAQGLSRDAIGIDLDPRNLDLARDRVGMFLDVA